MKRTWTDEGMKAAVENSITYAEAMKKLGLRVNCGNWRTVKGAIRRLELDTSHMVGQRHGTTVPKHKRILAEVMTKHSDYNPVHLKKRLIEGGMLKNECSLCGQEPEWKGKRLVMILDHINGESDDHRGENLRLLCPNCNSQQPTFSRGSKGFNMQSGV